MGPVTIGVLLKSGLAVAFFNIFLFYISVEIAATIPGVDKYMLVFLLAICSETVAALVTLNKEILVLLSAFIFAKYVYSERRSWFLLSAALVISLFARWEQIFVILLFLFLRRKGSFFSRNPKLAVLSVIGVLTVLYGLIARCLALVSGHSRITARAPTRSSCSMRYKQILAFHSFWRPRSLWI